MLVNSPRRTRRPLHKDYLSPNVNSKEADEICPKGFGLTGAVRISPASEAYPQPPNPRLQVLGPKYSGNIQSVCPTFKYTRNRNSQ